jgi:hypothetical protein
MQLHSKDVPIVSTGSGGKLGILAVTRELVSVVGGWGGSEQSVVNFQCPWSSVSFHIGKAAISVTPYRAMS